MRYYTDGYEYYSQDRDDFDCPDDCICTADIDHREGDTYATVLREGAWDGAGIIDIQQGVSLDAALEAWACNCDEIYQVRDGIAIYFFSTSEGAWNIHQPISEILEEGK